jgi:hypothetical protein
MNNNSCKNTYCYLYGREFYGNCKICNQRRSIAHSNQCQVNQKYKKEITEKNEQSA